jgi:hypothetical protein
MKPRGKSFPKGHSPWNKQNKIEQTCEYCKSTYYAWPYEVRNNRRFCSRKCVGKHMGEYFHIAYRGKGNPMWKHGGTDCYYVREAIRIHGYNCQNCGTDKIVDTHHIDGNHFNNPEDGSNWRRLCTKCHMRHHLCGRRTPKPIYICEHCGKHFQPDYARAKNRQPAKYCSYTCSARRHQSVPLSEATISPNDCGSPCKGELGD